MVLSTPEQEGQAAEIAESLGPLSSGVLATATMHTPIDVTERALTSISDAGADCTVAVGGGSTIGLAKAIALRADVPQVAIPTTYAGSEMTTILGQTENGVKTTLKDRRVLPASVIYDVDYTLSLPTAISATSGMNAIAHAIEALYAQEKNPISRLQCLEAIGALAEALPVIIDDPGNVTARQQAQYGAFFMRHGTRIPPAWRCITSFVTRWAAPSTCRMQKPILSSCPMPPASTRRRRRNWSRSRTFWTRTASVGDCGILPSGSTHRHPLPRSA